MSKLIFSRPLGDDLSPFGFSCKQIAPAAAIVAGAAISAGSGLGQSALQHYENVRQQHFESDEAEKAYNRQRQLMQDEYNYSKQLWEANNEYNSPKNQIKLLREANLNPYVYSHGSDIGTGVSGSPASSPSAPSVSMAHGSAAQMPSAPDLGRYIMEGSALQNDRMRSFADLVDSYPKLLEACDGDEKLAEEVMKSLSGIAGLNGKNPYKFAVAKTLSAEAQAESDQVQAFLAKKYGDRNAANMISQSEALINESFARVRKMASDAKVNDVTIDKLASDIVVNVANAWKLKKEGEKFVAEANTVNQLRQYLVSQARSKANMMDLQSLLSGAEPDTDLNDFFTSGDYMKGIMETKEIDQANSSSLLIRAMDKVFGEYIKVSSGGSTSNFNYSNSNEFRY